MPENAEDLEVQRMPSEDVVTTLTLEMRELIRLQPLNCFERFEFRASTDGGTPKAIPQVTNG